MRIRSWRGLSSLLLLAAVSGTQLGSFSASFSASAAEKVLDFSSLKEGEVPQGYSSVLAGSGKPGEWKITMEPNSTQFALKGAVGTKDRPSQIAALSQISRDPTDERFPMFLWDGDVFGDLTLTTHFKINGGGSEQIAGVVFRAKDARNCYVARANALDGNVRFYKFVNGERSAPIGNSMPITKGEWHELTVICRGTKIQVRLDGKEAMPELTDNSFIIGKVGFITKSDSQASFSDAVIQFQPLESLASALVRDLVQRQPRLINVRIYGKTTARNELHVLAARTAADVGQAAGETDLKVFAENQAYFTKTKVDNQVIAPLHDRNGETVGVVKFFLKPFPGQTEANTIARVLPLVRDLEERIGSANDLGE
jgi:hypothetical protein